MNGPNGRAVVVAGCRTPFTRAFGSFLHLDTIDLGVAAVRGLLERSGIAHSAIDGIVWGGVVIPTASPNIGREIALDLKLPWSVEAMTVTRACASGLQAITTAVSSIERGDADVLIAGGSDSTSNGEVPLPRHLIRSVAPVAMSSKSGPGDWLGVLPKLWPPSRVLPSMPKIAERTTGEVMGQACERMAERNAISREEQDAFAVRSHHRAAKAWADGRFDREVVAVSAKGKTISSDELVRGNTSAERMAKLRPAFRKGGTLTAGNSSALTDGAASVLLMSERKAEELGLTPLAAFKSWAYSGVDPSDQLLIGPALAMPKALDRAGMQLGEIDLVDMHEAFAAQVLSVVKMLESDAFARQRLGRDAAVGQIDVERFNVHGGSLALGHPFAATGARMVSTMAYELADSGKDSALLGICAAGGLGAAAVMERVG